MIMVVDKIGDGTNDNPLRPDTDLHYVIINDLNNKYVIETLD